LAAPELVVTVTLAVPDTLVFWVEVAVMVSDTVEVTVGAVSRPELLMVPALVVQVTFELKLPVPPTVAEHWLVPPEPTVEGVQLTLTEVTVPEPPPLPPQAANHITLPSKKNKNPNLRTSVLL
jgi:hypothetical protein